MSQERSARQVLRATLAGKQPVRRPRNRWYDYAYDLAWSRLGVELAHYLRFLKIMRLFESYFDCCFRDSLEESQHKNEWKNEAF